MDNSKKCAICGNELTRYGNKQLKDGILCRDCVKLASPWLNDDDYLARDTEAMKKHLEYREMNKEKLKDFVEERSVKGKYSLYLDEDTRQFVISKRKDFKKDNADLLSYDEIEELSIFEEKYSDEQEGVDLLMDIRLSNPEIGNICFRINEFPGLEKDSEDYKKTLSLAFEYLNAFDGEKGIDFEQTEGEKYE